MTIEQQAQIEEARQHTMDCPVCKGRGKLNPPVKRKAKAADNRVMAKLLVDAGYSYRETMRFLGYKSSRSIAILIGKS